MSEDLSSTVQFLEQKKNQNESHILQECHKEAKCFTDRSLFRKSLPIMSFTTMFEEEEMSSLHPWVIMKVDQAVRPLLPKVT